MAARRIRLEVEGVQATAELYEDLSPKTTEAFWQSLPVEARERVRTLQRSYVALWAARLREVEPDLPEVEANVRVHAAFGLLNSTPHSAFLPEDGMRVVLHDMAARALRLAVP